MARTLARTAHAVLVGFLVGFLAVGPFASRALAGPQGEVVKRGDVTFEHVEGSREWIIHAPNGSIIEYSSFDIAGGDAREVVEFRQGGANARVLNRIQSELPTRIDGTLLGDGHVYILNPAGVSFGNGATVNVNGLHAAAGNLSDRDFIAGEDRYTGLRGTVENQAAILANAVSLVGARVVNSGSILSKSGEGWVVLAAGEDVLIGLDQSGRGILLRIEGGAAAFDPESVGVSNTGTIAGDCPTQPCDADPARVTLGAGDLYGTAIFSTGAIRARETLALRAGNRGDVALGGELSAERLEVGFHGSELGELRGADAGATTTVLADEVSIDAKDSGGLLDIGSGVALRSRTTPASGPERLEVAQTSTLASSQIAPLDFARGAGTTLHLESRAGDVVIDDKVVVAGTQLELEAGLADLRGTEALQVASLAVTGSLVSDGDVIATAGDIAVSGDVLLVTKPEAAEDDSVVTLLSAHDGDLDVDGAIATDDGGRLRIEAENVLLGRLNAAGQPISGSITSTGRVRSGVEIGFLEGGVQQTQTVLLNGSIQTRGGSEDVAGGDVTIDATGDVRVSSIDATGALSGNANDPDADGGSVRIRAGSAATLRASTIRTGGADQAEAGEVQRGEVELSAGTIVLSGSIDALASSADNAHGERDRNVRLDSSALHLTQDTTTIDGHDVTLTGRIEGRTPENAAKQVGVDILATGEVQLTGGMDVNELRVDSAEGRDVVLRGDVEIDTTLTATFATAGTGVLRGSGDAGAATVVQANRVVLTATDPEVDAGTGTTAAVDLGDDLAFELAEIPASGTTAAVAPSFVLQQDASLDAARIADAFTPARFVNGVVDLSITLGTGNALELDGAGRAALADSKLVLTAKTFTSAGATGAPTDLEVASLDLTTRDALELGMGVTADRVRVASGASGTGNLTVSAALHADEIALVAGNGVGGGSESSIGFGAAGALRDRAGENADHVELIQDASIATASLEQASRFGGSVAGMEYVLESREGEVVVSQGAAAQSRIAGSQLTLRGAAGVELGAETLELASLTAETPETLELTNRINAQPGGLVRLHGGSDGSGDLEIASRISADRIELVAGVGNGTAFSSKVQIQDGAHFTSAADELRPDAFLMQQDAAIGLSASSTQVPDNDLFGDGNIAGMELGLRSKGAGLQIDDVTRVNGTTLALEGDNGVDVNGSLDVIALSITGDAAISGNVDADDDIRVGRLTLDGTGDQSVKSENGALTATAAIAKSSDGALTVEGRQVTALGISTAHTGGALTVTGRDGITAGALDASGIDQKVGGMVTVTSTNGAVVLASVSSAGSNGRPAEDDRVADAGSAGAAISVSGATVTVGNVNSSGGNAGAIDEADDQTAAAGGAAGAITLTSTQSAPEIVLNGAVTAVGGTGSSPDANALPALRGVGGAVRVEGQARLNANRTSGGGNEIRGHSVTLTHGATRSADRAAGETALTIVADDVLSIGGDIQAGRVDLEVHDDALDLASTGVSRIDADTIRLAATDGQGGQTDGVVVLDGLVLANEATSAAPLGFTLDQDASIGVGGTDLPDASIFAGPIVTDTTQMSLGLISRDGTIELDAARVAQVAGTNLTLAANGRLAGGTQPNVRISGADLDVKGLTLGAGSGSLGTVGGDAEFGQALRIGTSGLSARGNIDVSQGATIAASASFTGTGDQRVQVGAGHALELGGLTVSKNSDGALRLLADRIELTNTSGTGQTIEARRGQLEIGAALVKGTFDAQGQPVSSSLHEGLTLRGFTTDASQPAIVVHGTRTTTAGEYALAVADGDLVVDARVLDSPAATGQWSLDGDVLAYGDIHMSGAGVLRSGAESYTIEARREAATATAAARGGDVSLGGIAGTDGDLAVLAAGDVPSDLIPKPSAILLRGDYDVSGALTLAGQVGTVGATQIRADDAIEFTRGIQGVGDLDVRSRGAAVRLADDVALSSAARLAVAGEGESGVLFASDSRTQTISAGSIDLGGGASRPPSGRASVFRDGDLTLRATAGDVSVGSNQALVVAGDLDIDASGTALLADTAALHLDVNAGDISVHSGSTVMANRIETNARPRVAGGGGATFATPTGTELSDDIPGDEIVVRSISADGSPLSYAELASGDFPEVDGPARFDYARQTPHAPSTAEIAVPRADVFVLQAGLRTRPLWAEELIAYLDARARRPENHELVPLPPVGAGPDDALPAGDPRLRSAAVEQTASLYRALFFPDADIDPETGFVTGEDHEREIRQSLQRAVDVLRREGDGVVRGADLAARIESDTRFGEARRYKRELAELCSAARPVLAADQQPRFDALVLARVAPHGVAPAELGALVR